MALTLLRSVHCSKDQRLYPSEKSRTEGDLNRPSERGNRISNSGAAFTYSQDFGWKASKVTYSTAARDLPDRQEHYELVLWLEPLPPRGAAALHPRAHLADQGGHSGGACNQLVPVHLVHLLQPDPSRLHTGVGQSLQTAVR